MKETKQKNINNFVDSSIIPESEEPLVSVIVITYNSSEFVLETLESAKNQTYKNIELIISDDCSTDNTVDICKKWLEENKDNFVNTQFITVEKNTGITPNCNRGVYASKGEWLKLIAGDDILLDNCISNYVSLIKKSNSDFIFGQVIFSAPDERNTKRFNKGYELFNQKGNKYRHLLKECYLPAPSFFLNRKSFFEMGCFDERFIMMEDHPFFLKIAKHKKKIAFFDIKTVIYRSTYKEVDYEYLKTHFFVGSFPFLDSKYKFTQRILIINQLLNGLFLYAWENFILLLRYKVAIMFDNKKKPLARFIYNFLGKLKPSSYPKLFPSIFPF